ncbi:fungal-specific transcription factor domain-containing protein [Paraphoma chrysanthemicola]|nr:fungal-specific transcription factor domain-containing protein [Paraphoma chrysanthemicola]
MAATDNNPSSASPGVPVYAISSVPQKRSLEPAAVRQKTKVTRACDLCKSKKSKCSGEQPCESCKRRGLDCQYEAVYSRGRPPPPARRADRPSIESSNSPQSSIVHHRSPISSVQSDSAFSSQYRTELPRPSTASFPVMASKLPGVPEGIPEAPSRGSPGLEVAGQFSDPTSGLSFLHRAWRRISNNENSQVMAGQAGTGEDHQLLIRAGDKPFAKSSRMQMPSLSRGQDLLELYFNVCIATYRLLHRPSVEGWCTTVFENAQSGKPLTFDIGSAKACVVLSVLAVASFHEEKAKGEGGFMSVNPHVEQAQARSDEYFSEAWRISEEETGYPRLESAQSRLIQVLYLLMSSRFNQAWYTFGHAMQIISALGLHRKLDRKRTSSAHARDYIEEQCQRRTFWVAYTLDKYLGVMFGRPRHYHDDDIDQDFPDSVNDEDMFSSGPQVGTTDDCHIDSLILHAKLAQIAEKISREVYSIKPNPDHDPLAASHRLGAELRQWRASLPPLLGAINPSSLIASFRRQATALKLSYCHAVMLAHRPFLLKLYSRDSQGMRTLAKQSVAECIMAARSVLEAVDRMAKDGRLFHAFWWTHYVCFCALVVVYVWAIKESNDDSSIDERRKILDHAERCLGHLAQATATNSPSRKYSIILQELRAEAKRKTARPLAPQHPPMVTPAPLPSDAAGLISNQDVAQMNVDPVQQVWQPLFGSPIDTNGPGLQNFLDGWQTTDWLHVDSSAFGPFPEFDGASMAWNPTFGQT